MGNELSKRLENVSLEKQAEGVKLEDATSFGTKTLIVSILTCLIVGYMVGQAWIGEPKEEIDRLKAEKRELLDTYLQYRDACFDLKDQLENITTELYHLQIELAETKADYEALQQSYAELIEEYVKRQFALIDFDRDYRIKVPEDSEYLTLIGELSSAPFPLSRYEVIITDDSEYIVKNVLVIEAPNPLNESRREIFYMFQDGPGMVVPRFSKFYEPSSTGYKLLGGIILTEINEAYRLGLTVEVEGSVFKYTRLGSQYNLVKVEKVRIRETWKIPLIVSHNIDMIRGNEHCGISGEKRVDFPYEFPVGLTTIQGEFGNAEHTYHVLLNPDESIRIEFNSTVPVKFGLMKPESFIYHGYYLPTDTSLSMADPEDFYIRHTEIQSLKTEFTAPERGFYNLVFKAYSGEMKGTVVLKITRTCPENGKVQRRE